MLCMAIGCGPLGPYVRPHTSWDPVMGSHVFVGPDGGVAGLVGSVVGFGFGRLVSSFVGVRVWAFSCPTGPLPGTAQPPPGLGRGGAEAPRRGWSHPGIPPKRHHTSARGYHGWCPSLPVWGRGRGRPSGRLDRRDGRPSSRSLHPWGRRSWSGVWAVAVFGGVGRFGGSDRLCRPCGGGGAGAFGLFAMGERRVVALRSGFKGELFFRTFF